MHKSRYISSVVVALIAFASLAVGMAGCGGDNCHEDEGCASGAGGAQGQGGGATDAGAD